MFKIKGNVFITILKHFFFLLTLFYIKSCLVQGDNPTHTFYVVDLRVREMCLLALVCTSALLSHYIVL